MKRAFASISFLLSTLAIPAMAGLLFHATFDGDSPVAAEARGAAAPLAARGIRWTDGVKGRAARFSRDDKSVLAYADSGNLNHDCGTVSLWFRSDAPMGGVRNDDPSGFGPMHYLLASPFQKERNGTHALILRFFQNNLRCDVSDDADSYKHSPASDAFDGAWHHVAWTWDRGAMGLYLDGTPRASVRDDDSPLKEALASAATGGYRFSRLVAFDRFFVGNQSGGGQCEGAIDELRIYDEILDSAQIAALAAEFSPPKTPAAAAPDYRTLFAQKGGNPYVGAPAAVPGVIPGDDLELVEEVRLDSPEAVERLRAAERLREIGGVSFGATEGASYAELGGKAGNRLALRFADPGDASPLCVFDIDYPDDKPRTMDVIVQRAEVASGDYTMQCGVATGGEYPLSGAIATHRCVWWRRPGEAALVLMTARDGAPAAARAVRLWRVKSGTLPPAVSEGSGGSAPRRHIALYFEDPAIGHDFSVPDEISTPVALVETIDRAVATMRFAGEDVLAYPGAWYQGLIGAGYNPRNHAPDFLSGWYERFDAEGDLGFFPTLNVQNMPLPGGLVTPETMMSGALHASPVSIFDTGLPNQGGWHGTPPNFNIAHPDVQKYVFDIVGKLAAQGAPHPSFRGVCLHVTRHALLSWGSLESGYNDYCIDAFEKATGLAVPRDRDDPLRGKACAEWLRAHPDALEAWIDWRCGVLTDFWAEIARRLREVRPDLLLWVNACSTSYIKQDWATEPDFVSRANREFGIDAARLTAAIPNLVLSQCVIPADYLWRGRGLDPARREMQRALCDREETYALLKDAVAPWVAQHDRYWESPIGRGKDGAKTLSCDWLQECRWRVSTINPSGSNALRAFVLPLRFNDVLGMSKGGFLIGTYGMEPHLARFARAFRALPAVKMDEFYRDGAVVARKAEADGRTYGYVVNTDAAPTTVEIAGLPAKAVNLVDGSPLSASLALGPYEMVSFISR